MIVKSPVKKRKKGAPKTINSQLLCIKKKSEEIISQINKFSEDKISEKIINIKSISNEIKQLDKQNEEISRRQDMRNSIYSTNKKKKRKELETIILDYRKESNKQLDIISTLISENLSSKAKTERLLGNLNLIHSDESKIDNPVLKPTYTSSLVVTLLKNLVDTNYKFKDEMISSRVDKLKKKSEDSNNYQVLSKSIIEPVIKAIFIYQSSLKSDISKEIIGDNKQVSDKIRIKYLRESKKKSLEFLIEGVNLIKPEIGTNKDIRQWTECKKEELLLINYILSTINTNKSEISKIIQICQQYTSFILPDKDYGIKDLKIHAYDILKKRANEKKVDPAFTDKLINTMGKFPIGTGVYIYGTENQGKHLEKGIVTQIYPENPEIPTIKQISSKETLKLRPDNFSLNKENNLFYSISKFPKEISATYIARHKAKDNSLSLIWRPDKNIAGTMDINNIW